MSCKSNSQNNLDFEVYISQDSSEYKISNNNIKLYPEEFTIKLILPAYMLNFNNQDYSSINYIATTDKAFFKLMHKSICFTCVTNLFPYAFDKHNSGENMVIGNDGYSFWTISEDPDDHNVTSYEIQDDKIHAIIKIKNFLITKENKTISLKEFKGTVYIIFEAVNRESTEVGKRTFMKIKFK